MNLKEIKEIIEYFIQEVSPNQQAKNRNPITISIVGESGIGKTSVIENTVLKHGYKLKTISLANFDEVGDLVGYPIVELEVEKDGKLLFIDKDVKDIYLSQGWELTGRNQTGYAPPEWIPSDFGNTPYILLLDDYNRAIPSILTACMELIDRHKYVSWTLPSNCHIILSENPDDGEYNVTSSDKAQKTRPLKFMAEFDIKIWAEWAEEAGIDQRCINFLLKNPEVISGDVNVRILTKFFNAIEPIKDFSKEYRLIQNIGQESIGDAVKVFIVFIEQKLDKLITPREIIENKNSIQQMKDLIGEGANMRVDILGILTTRLVNYLKVTYKDKAVPKEVTNKLIKILTANVFKGDNTLHIAKSLATNRKFNSVNTNTKVQEIIFDSIA